MTQEKCDKAVNRCFWEFYFILDQYKTQEMCDRVVSKDSLLILYYPDKFEIQRKCDEAVDDSLASLKLIADWFVASRMITKFTALWADENILYFNEDSGNVVFSCNENDVLNIDLNNINLYNNFDEDKPNTIILIKLLVLHIKFENVKHLTKS